MTYSYLNITGDDRTSFLQGILTQDVTKLPEQKIQFAALLSPQGKILNDLFLIHHANSITVATSRDQIDTLKKRLTMYKLRAKVMIADGEAPKVQTLPDPRHPDLPPFAAGNHEQRVKLGIPEFGIDIAPDSITAMDAGYDLLNAMSFTKGCYVGQEVTARMYYKNIARKGFFIVKAETPLTVGTPIMVGERSISSITSTHENHGLAFLKFEDAELPAFVDKKPVKILAPRWMQPKWTLFADNAKKQ